MKVQRHLPELNNNDLLDVTKEVFVLIYALRDIIVGHDGGVFLDRLEDLYKKVYNDTQYQKYVIRFNFDLVNDLLNQIPALEIVTGSVKRRRICRINGAILSETHRQFSKMAQEYFCQQNSALQPQQIKNMLLDLTQQEFENINTEELGPLYEDFNKIPMKSISLDSKIKAIEKVKLKRKKQKTLKFIRNIKKGSSVVTDMSYANSQLTSNLTTIPNSCGISNIAYDTYFRGTEDLDVIKYRRFNTTQENIEQKLRSRK